jgi:valyl-tRNA synthetase
VWYAEDGRTFASREDLTHAPDGSPLRQDEDVLDTWFSSALVPFSSLGWPDKTPDLKRFYPGDTLVTGPDIIFFWVSRMVMMGLECMGDVPFRTVYLNGIVRDTNHKKMSKSAGNGLDPLEVIDRFGADAFRYTIASGMAAGTDVILDPKDLDTSFAPGRNFANKLWNAGRFLLSNLAGAVRPLAGAHRDAVRHDELQLADRWIIARCDATVREATDLYARYRINEAAAVVYHFLWSDFADWYIEQIKPRLYGDQPGGDVARAVAVRTFDTALRLLHPIMPFITEALWQRLPHRTAHPSISVTRWPVGDSRATDAAALTGFALVQELVGAVRGIRSEYDVSPGTAVRLFVTPGSPAAAAAFVSEEPTIARLAKVSAIEIAIPTERVGGNAVLSDGTSVFVPLGDAIDLGRECERLGTEVTRLRTLIANQEQKLGNAQFVSRAPAEVVEKERQKLASWREQASVLDGKRQLLGC